MSDVTTLDLTPTMDTVLLHFASSLSGDLTRRKTRSELIAYISAGTNRTGQVIVNNLTALKKDGLIEITGEAPVDGLIIGSTKKVKNTEPIFSLTDLGREYLKLQGWSFDQEKTKTNTAEKPKRARKPRRDRADNAPAGLPSDADAETLASNRAEMSKPRTTTSHADCEHESTKAARSACRKARAQAAAN